MKAIRRATFCNVPDYQRTNHCGDGTGPGNKVPTAAFIFPSRNDSHLVWTPEERCGSDQSTLTGCVIENSSGTVLFNLPTSWQGSDWGSWGRWGNYTSISPQLRAVPASSTDGNVQRVENLSFPLGALKHVIGGTFHVRPFNFLLHSTIVPERATQTTNACIQCSANAWPWYKSISPIRTFLRSQSAGHNNTASLSIN